MEKREGQNRSTDYILDSIEELQDGQRKLSTQHNDLKLLIEHNTSITEDIKNIFEGMQSFWKFCRKTGNTLSWMAKKGTPIVIFGSIIYNGLYSVLHHDIGISFKLFWDTFRESRK